MNIIDRAGWNARAPLRVSHIATPTPRLWLHHTAAESHGPGGVRSTQNYHMDTKGWADIGYSFLVDDDGSVYEGRGAGVAGAHTEGDNTGSHGIACMGDYGERPPTPAMLDAVVGLVVHGYRHRWWPGHLTGGHRDAPGAQTACPGSTLYALIPDLNRRIAVRTREDDDMAWSEKDSENLAAVRSLLESINHHVAGTVEKGARLPTLMRDVDRIADKVAGQD